MNCCPLNVQDGLNGGSGTALDLGRLEEEGAHGAVLGQEHYGKTVPWRAWGANRWQVTRLTSDALKAFLR